jgi:FtsZ-binding cell division protein ZapB
MPMKKAALAIVLIFILAVSTAGWLMYNQINALQNQNTELQNQNRELQTQNKELQDQNNNLQSRLSNLQDQISELLNQISAMSSVKITAFKWVGDFNPIVGLTIGYTVNVAIWNNSTIDVNGLTLTVRLQYVETGTEFGDACTKKIDAIHANETQWVSGMVLAGLGSFSSDSAVCKITLRNGALILDQWTRSLTDSSYL